MSLLKISSLKYVMFDDIIGEFCHVQTYNTYDNIPYQRYLLYKNIGLVLGRYNRSYIDYVSKKKYNAVPSRTRRRLRLCCFV